MPPESGIVHDQVLAQAEAMVADDRLIDAVELLHEANGRSPSDDVERRLAVLRHAAYPHLSAGSHHESWPVPVSDPDRSGLTCSPEVDPDDLCADTVRRAIAAHGSALVRSLLGPGQVAALVEVIERTLEQREAGRDQPFRVTSSWFAGLPLLPEEAASLGRGWIAGAGGVLACDAPKALDHLLRTYEEVGLRDVVADYLGERPILSANKCTLRRVPTTAKADWHQDGAFLGSGIRALNVWVALSDCGVDAPGLDIVPRRFEALAPTGTGGALFDWAVGPDVVAELAAETPVVRPHFRAGDALLFDDLFLHRTAVAPDMTRARYAIESWFFAATGYPNGQVPLVW